MDSGSSYDSDTVPSSDDEDISPNPRPWKKTLADSHAWQMETLESLRGARESSPPVPPD